MVADLHHGDAFDASEVPDAHVVRNLQPVYLDPGKTDPNVFANLVAKYPTVNRGF